MLLRLLLSLVFVLFIVLLILEVIDIARCFMVCVNILSAWAFDDVGDCVY